MGLENSGRSDKGKPEKRTSYLGHIPVELRAMVAQAARENDYSIISKDAAESVLPLAFTDVTFGSGKVFVDEKIIKKKLESLLPEDGADLSSRMLRSLPTGDSAYQEKVGPSVRNGIYSSLALDVFAAVSCDPEVSKIFYKSISSEVEDNQSLRERLTTIPEHSMLKQPLILTAVHRVLNTPKKTGVGVAGILSLAEEVLEGEQLAKLLRETGGLRISEPSLAGLIDGFAVLSSEALAKDIFTKNLHDIKVEKARMEKKHQEETRLRDGFANIHTDIIRYAELTSEESLAAFAEVSEGLAAEARIRGSAEAIFAAERKNPKYLQLQEWIRNLETRIQEPVLDAYVTLRKEFAEFTEQTVAEYKEKFGEKHTLGIVDALHFVRPRMARLDTDDAMREQYDNVDRWLNG